MDFGVSFLAENMDRSVKHNVIRGWGLNGNEPNSTAGSSSSLGFLKMHTITLKVLLTEPPKLKWECALLGLQQLPG